MKSAAGKRWLITGLALVSVIAVLAAFKVQEIMGMIAFAESFPEPSESVEVYVVEGATFQPMKKVYAQVIAPQRLELRNELGGVIERVGFAAGDTVAKDQLLLALDVREEKAKLRALEARRVLASRTFERSEKLYAQNRISQQALDEARAEFDAVEAEITQVRVQIDKKQITAPFAARTGLHHLEPGALLPAQSDITTLIGLGDTLWLEFELPQNAMPLALADTVDVLVSDRRFSAKIIARDAELSESARNRRYRAAFHASQTELLPQAVVNIEVPATEPRNVALIPDTALRVDQLGNYVYRLKADESGIIRAYRQPVTVGSRRQNRVAILSGLSVGDRIAAKGAFKLRDEIKVSVKEPGAEPQS